MSAVERGARSASVEAQAKVNLRLRILAREASGFHQLETLFLRIALADTVRLSVTAGARTLDVESGLPSGSLGPVEKNLAWRAAAAYAEATGWPAGWAIELVKRIPVGGGLGGGSADAGAVLRALDALAPRPLEPAALLGIAMQLGADVPFLTTTHPYALAWGRGERLLPLAPLPVRSVVLVVPSFAVNTAAAYEWLAAARAATPAIPDVVPLSSTTLGDWGALEAIAVNDFEPLVAARHPEITRIIDALRAEGCRIALMSGSGSVVVGLLPAPRRGVDPPASQQLGPGHRLVTRTADAVAEPTPWDG